MIVADASVIVDFLLDVPPVVATIAGELEAHAPAVSAPHLIDAEVGHALRTLLLRRQITTARARGALEDLLALPIERYPHAPFLPRAFELRDNATIYDGLYLALAEALDARLLTKDQALARVPGISAQIEVIGAAN